METGFLLGHGAAALKWIIARVADSDDKEAVGENAAKIVANLVMACLGDAAGARFSSALAGRELRRGDEPLNGYIEQAYRAAELGALCSFLRRLHRSGLLPGDAHAGEGAAHAIRALSTLKGDVLHRRDIASIQGIELEHLAATMSSLNAGQWEQADARARRTRHAIEERALRELEITTDRAPSPAFRQALREGLGPQVVPWFGILSHTFLHVLLNKDKQEAKESLMLRLMSRLATTLEPGVEPKALEQALREPIAALQAQGRSLGEGVAGMFARFGEQLGSRLELIESGLDDLRRSHAEFRQAWQAHQRALDERLDEVILLARESRDKLDRLILMVEGLGTPPPLATPASSPTAAWQRAGLPGVPPADWPSVGRETEVHAVRAFLQSEAKTLLRISGRGGSGKTTLVADALRQGVQRPVIYVKTDIGDQQVFARLFDAFDRLLRSMGEAALATDLRYPTVKAKTERLFERLAALGLRVIVVLDSLEQGLVAPSRRLRDADLEAFVLACLDAQQALQVIACAQRWPDVQTQGQVRRLLAAGFERQSEIVLGSGLGSDAASLALLRQLIATARPELQAADEPALLALCRSVGGNPNAIKHVAVALACDRLLDPASLLAALQSPGAADEAVQQIQDALIGRHFDQLDALQQQVLQALAVLGSGASQASLAATLVVEPAALRAALNGLLDRHLLSWGQDKRLQLHDSERSCYLHTTAPELLQALRRRAAAHFGASAAPPAAWKTFADAEPAIRQADLLHAAGEPAVAAALRLGVAEQLYRIGLALNALAVLEPVTTPQDWGADAEATAALRALCLWKTGAYEAASRVCEQALAAPLRREHPAWLTLRQTHATCRLELGLADQAVDAGLCLLSELDAGRHPEVRVRTLIDLAFAQSVAGRQNEALTHALQALDAARAIGGGNGGALSSLACAYAGLIQSYRGEFGAARSLYIEGLRHAREHAARYEHAIVLGHFCELELIEGRYELAMDLAAQALEAQAEPDAMSGSWCHWLFAMALALDPDRLEAAEARALQACRFTRLLNDPNPRVLLGLTLLRRGMTAAAIEALEHAVAIAAQLVRACPTNWEARVASGFALLLLASTARAHADEAMAQYRAAHAASPWPGHLPRIALQLQIASPVLLSAGLDPAPALRALYTGA